MPTFNFYSAWMDPVFYLWALAAAAALVGLIYSIRRYLELKNAAFDEEAAAEEAPAADAAAALPAEPAEAVQPELPAELPEAAEAEPPAPAPAQPAAAGPAETFVRGIYDGISGLDARMKNIEASLSRGRVNNDFTVKFLEDILQDIENLDKQKIKARIEYLLSDLKK